MSENLLTNTMLEKAALDSGFDLQKSSNAGWLAFASSHCPLRIWLKMNFEPQVTKETKDQVAVAFSSLDVSKEISDIVRAVKIDAPSGASATFVAKDISSLYPLLKRAFQLSRSLPSEPLREFQKQTQGLPQSTEVERTVIQRVGQDIFRERLIEFWDGKCAVTGLAIPALLKASHIKPWSKCASDAERLDVFNGLLLAPHVDAAFDKGFITFSRDGSLLVAKELGQEGLVLLGIKVSMKCNSLTENHQGYLEWHRKHEFKGL